MAHGFAPGRPVGPTPLKGEALHAGVSGDDRDVGLVGDHGQSLAQGV